MAALHVVAIYALTNANSEFLSGFSPPPLQVMLLAEAVAAVEPPPPPPVKLEPPRVDVEPPIVPAIELPEEPASSTAITLAFEPRTPSRHALVGAPQLVSEVEYVVAPQPGYPSVSRRLREQGLVVLRVLVDERGKAQQLLIHESSGHERLDNAAIEAVERAAFKPYVANGLAQRVYVLIPIEFALNRAGNPRG